MSTPRIDLGSEQLASTLWSEIEVVQRLNDHWTCRIVMRDTPDRRPPVEDFAGQTLKISTFELDGSENVVFSGFVRHMRLIYEVTGAFGAELEAVSSTWKLAQGPRLEYYRQQTAQAAAQKALSSCSLSVSGAMPAGPSLSYVQWDETDFSFFSRLVDDVEAWFRPAVDGSDSIEVQTSFQAGATVNWRQGEYGLLEWTTRGRLQPTTAQGAHYDPQTMMSATNGGVTSSTGFFGGAATAMVAAVQTGSGTLEARWADRNRAATLADLEARLEREARRGLASAVTCTGVSRDPHVRAGDTLAVTGLPGVDATYGVIEAVHRWTPQGYENQFTATPAQRWSPPVRPRRPYLDGIYPARVVDNHDPHNQGRIRVQYYWQEANQTTWVRLLSSHAGPGRGFLFLPELGDEVLITFEEGDAERPYVVGSAWNGVHQPPAAGFHQPGETNGSEFAANNIKRIVTKSGHRITLVDTPGKETISLTTPKSTRLMLTEDHQDTGRPAIVLESLGDMILAAPNGRIHSQAKFHSRQVGAAATVDANVVGATPPLRKSGETQATQGPAHDLNGNSRLRYRFSYPPKIVSAAQATEKKYGIPASVTLAQWALESRDGKSMPSGSNNPFGIKAVGNQPYVRAWTKEMDHGKLVNVEQNFRKYDSIDDAFNDHGRLLAEGNPYENARKFLSNPDDFADALSGIYAPNIPGQYKYGEKLRYIMDDGSLRAFNGAK